jgi:hypothetical protein
MVRSDLMIGKKQATSGGCSETGKQTLLKNEVPV